jgi:hypothetical protein
MTMKRIISKPWWAPFVSVLSGLLIIAGGAVSSDFGRSIEIKGVSVQCLACHGSYDELIAATADYRTSKGVAVNPHQYVPHAEKKGIPDCTDCHVAHPIPLTDAAQVERVESLSWCYMRCHHTSTFDACGRCH